MVSDTTRNNATFAGMSQQVRGVIARAKGEPVTMETIVIPDPGPGEAVVVIQACGVCHTDLHAITGEYRLMVFQFSGFDAIHGDFSCFADARDEPPPAVGKFGYQSVQNHTDTNQLPD